MSWLSDRLKEAVPYAMMELPFTPVGPGISAFLSKWKYGDKAMKMLDAVNKSKFMSSVPGAALKDAGLKYALATAQGKRNPHIIAKDALLRNMFTNAYKVGFDPNLMMGGDKTIPATFGKFGDKMEGPIPAVMGQHDTTFTPNIDYAMPKVSAAYEMVPGSGAPFQYTVPRYTGGINEEALKNQIAQIQAPTMYTQIPAMEGFTIPGEDIQGPLDELAMADVKNPLAGMGYMTTTKTKPSMLDRLLGKVKEAKELNIERGSDEWNEMFDIGATRPDSAWLAGTMYDYLRDPWTDEQIKQKEQEDYEERMRRLMWPRSMADVPNFQSAFLGNKGGIASLSNGGMGPGPYTDPIAGDDFDVDVQDIIQGPGFESIDELGSLFGDPDEIASAPHPMEGWYDMFFDTFGRYPKNEAELIQFINEADVDLQQTGRSIGPAGASTVSEDGTRMMAKDGGIMGYMGGGELNAIPGGMISGPGTETSDSIPAQLSNNEFVITADAVRAAGGGDIDLGAQKFYGIMNALDPNSAKPGEPPVYS